MNYVPFRNVDEFRMIYENLYSNDIVDKKWAVNRLQVWDARGESLPEEIYVTWKIVSAVIMDILAEHQRFVVRKSEVPGFYTHAISKFVELVTKDAYQKKVSMSVQAERKKIPSWIVELRNQALHAELPALDLIHKAIPIMLNYLEETYWTVQVSDLESCDFIPELDEESVAEAVVDFQNLQFNKMRNKIKLDEVTDGERKVLKRIKQLVKMSSREFINTFVKPGLFIFQQGVLMEILSEEERNYFEPEVLSLPQTIEDFWVSLLYILHRHDLTPDLLETLLSTQGDRDPDEQKQVLSWAVRLLEAYLFKDKPMSALTNMFQCQGCLFRWDRLMYYCLKYECKYSKELFPLLTFNGKMKKETVEKIMRTLGILPDDVVENTESLRVEVDEEYMENGCSTYPENAFLSAEVASFSCPDYVNLEQFPLGSVINLAGEYSEEERDEECSDEERDEECSEEERGSEFSYGSEDRDLYGDHGEEQRYSEHYNEDVYSNKDKEEICLDDDDDDDDLYIDENRT